MALVLCVQLTIWENSEQGFVHAELAMHVVIFQLFESRVDELYVTSARFALTL